MFYTPFTLGIGTVALVTFLCAWNSEQAQAGLEHRPVLAFPPEETASTACESVPCVDLPIAQPNAGNGAAASGAGGGTSGAGGPSSGGTGGGGLGGSVGGGVGGAVGGGGDTASGGDTSSGDSTDGGGVGGALGGAGGALNAGPAALTCAVIEIATSRSAVDWPTAARNCGSVVERCCRSSASARLRSTRSSASRCWSRFPVRSIGMRWHCCHAPW